MRIEELPFGTTSDGHEARLFRAAARDGLEVSVTDYGATLVSVRAPDRQGAIGEITLGFDSIEGYLGPHPYFGATVGRYANRISGGEFELNGERFRLSKNQPPHHLHGGTVGFNRVMWHATLDANTNSVDLTLSYTSQDGEEGYPGTLDVSLTYTVTDDNRLRLTYRATTDKPTVVNLTNHTYWNLDRPGVDVRDHNLRISSEKILVIDEDFVPTGKLADTKDGPFDFRHEKAIRRDFEVRTGYDHNFVIAGPPGTIRDAAEVSAPVSGRRMSVVTDQAAVQIYTGNMMEEITGRDEIVFGQYGALCLETGGFNDAVHHSGFPTSELKPGEIYTHITEHKFST